MSKLCQNCGYTFENKLCTGCGRKQVGRKPSQNPRKHMHVTLSNESVNKLNIIMEKLLLSQGKTIEYLIKKCNVSKLTDGKTRQQMKIDELAAKRLARQNYKDDLARRLDQSVAQLEKDLDHG